ncbi:MAG: hypothetical protein BroJett018_35340 [Chloroflexota bacterium]|nr:MAG: hypothetical protein BroJett018_35340 [Chloroflexota bacterium]
MSLEVLCCLLPLMMVVGFVMRFYPYNNAWEAKQLKTLGCAMFIVGGATIVLFTLYILLFYEE